MHSYQLMLLGTAMRSSISHGHNIYIYSICMFIEAHVAHRLSGNVQDIVVVVYCWKYMTLY